MVLGDTMEIMVERGRRGNSLVAKRTRWFLRNRGNTTRTNRLVISESECIERTPDIDVTVPAERGAPAHFPA